MVSGWPRSGPPVSGTLEGMGRLVPHAWRDQDFPRAFGVVAAAAALLALGTLLERWLTVAERAIPPRIYWEPSYSIAFLDGLPLPVSISAGFLLSGLAAWILQRPRGAGWDFLEAASGLRWVAFGVALVFTHRPGTAIPRPGKRVRRRETLAPLSSAGVVL